ncbi:hypothetical protein [Desulfonatronovibrio hydrogenovorans]|uniref:hypothetical protein n=1 Tax=Desulfonatronovibrio hydrogenovorans TaxID=53245 RepID=UPI00048B7DDC|nr:hypothetical protein [Desulfonatronovibrio hydrogenovorans]
MDKFGYFSGELADETLKEAADTFFGRRKKIDQELELFSQQVEQVRKKAREVESRAACLNQALPGQDSRFDFWQALGLEKSLYAKALAECSEQVSRPVSLTLRGRYEKTLVQLYEELRLKVDDYLFGRYIDHPEIKGKKTLTPNLAALKKWSKDLNQEIEKVNCSNRPDDVLAFTRRMDIEESSKRESVGSGLEYRFNQELCFKPVDFDSLELKEYPELSRDKKIRKIIAEVAGRIFDHKKNEIKKILNSLQ